MLFSVDTLPFQWIQGAQIVVQELGWLELEIY